VMEVAQKTMNDLATEKGYSIVYDLSAPNSPIVYSAKECNITEEIKNRLNAKGGAVAAPARGSSPAPATPGTGRGAVTPATPPPAGRGATTPATTTTPAGRGTTAPATTPPAPGK